MEPICYTSHSPADTFALGQILGQAALPGQIYGLSGPLGAGKTLFAKGFAAGLGVTDEVVSPTFTILNIYAGRLPLYHFDLYRLTNAAQMEDTGYEEFFYGEGVCLVEWPEQVPEVIPVGTWQVDIALDEDCQSRLITIKRGTP